MVLQRLRAHFLSTANDTPLRTCFPAACPCAGVVGLFPLLLDALPIPSDAATADASPLATYLNGTLALLRHPDSLWSPHGLRSLARTDPYYHMGVCRARARFSCLEGEGMLAAQCIHPPIAGKFAN